MERFATEPFALTFAGQGYPWLETLAQHHTVHAQVEDHVDKAAELLTPLADELAPFFPQGFAPIQWAHGERPAGLSEAAVSTPGIVVAQVAVLEALKAQGLDLTRAVACEGHSQGALGAVVAAGRAPASEVIALAQLIGAAAASTARQHGLIRTTRGCPMVLVRGVSLERLEKAGATVGLRNGRDAFVIVGTPTEVARVCAELESQAAREAKERENHTRGGAVFAPSFTDLDIQVAFHHPLMEAAVEQVKRWGAQVGLDAQLVEDGARAVLTAQVDWPQQVNQAVERGAKWILDCGPGSGVQALTAKVVQGRGVGTVLVSKERGQAQLFDAGQAPELPAPYSQFAPTKRGQHVITKFTELTGYSPVMLPGMTPTTVDPAIVAAAANAGHWAELAGGGQATAEILHENLNKLRALVNPGVNAQFNAMYLSPKAWRQQIIGERLVPKARAGGAPINGVVVSAGIPPVEEAVELISSLRADNIPWVAFKPGTVAQISQVLDIADAACDTPIIIQVEGGHAGGHHSWEDLDELLVETYAAIRERSNVVLAVGGGIGTPERGADYLDGTWAKAYDLPAMPVDAIMVGTAAMAAKESTASEGVKQALVAARATDANGGWAPSGQANGAIASGRSQLGADIHEIDNAFARAGRLLDEVAGDAGAVAARRAEIIEAINATCKPYFGDVSQMTYGQWLHRYVELAFRGQWKDKSWASRFVSMVARAEARLNPTDHGEFTPRVEVDTEKPTDAIDSLLAYYGDAPVHVADADWFLELLEGPGKPANFVPVINAEVRRLWRQDSLWQAHDDNYDADGVCIIPGPRAVAGIERANEPVADILARFEAAAAARISATAPTATPAQLIESAPTINWAGFEQPNPLHLVADARYVDGQLIIPLPGAMGPGGSSAAVDIRVSVEPPAVPGASPVVTESAAAESMTALAKVAAGGDFRGIAPASAGSAAHYENVTAGCAPGLSGVAADYLVGKAWPEIFAAIAGAHTPGGTPVVEGLLNLVHLRHRLRLTGEGSFADAVVGGTVGGAVDGTVDGSTCRVDASLRGVADTQLGRVVTVEARVQVGEVTAVLEEQFAIRGRTGSQPVPELDPVDFVEKPRSYRHTLVATAPGSMRGFARVTGDFNPIHTSAAAAALAGFDSGVIVHGMWTSALGQLAAAFDGQQVVSWDAQMLSPVLPGASVEYVVERSGVSARDGEGEVRTVTASVEGRPVLQATAVMSAPVTFYGFPGQGIQSPGMGMEAFAASPAARAVWERADRHTRQKLGFSILEIVRTNPPAVVVAGERFSHPEGVLYLTQFTQVAMATLGCAQVAEMQEAGVLEKGAYFAGHSVGEYNALAAYAQVLSLEAVVEIVYARGLTMHRLVDRDERGVSNYGLAALRPNKMGLSEQDVFPFITALAETTGEFLEIVNYNIAGVQYAVAGTRAGLEALAQHAEQRAPGQRAFIQIPGIDVPFHSSHLLDGVPAFRAHLDQLIPAKIDLDVLVGRYIPNLVARPFALDREFVEAVAEVVDSPVIAEVLANFADYDRNELGRTLLIELLAWQFASPVRWIETQDLLLGVADRFVEIGVGSSPTLANMLGQTLRLPQYAGCEIEVLNIERDRPTVFAEDAVEAPQEAVPEDKAAAAEAEVREAAAPAVAPAPELIPQSQPGAEPPADKAFTAADATEMLVAIWTKVRTDQMGATDTIEALVEGVSSRRNQLLLDLGVEFGLGAIDGAAEAPMEDLKANVAGQARGYKAFGPVLSEQVGESLRRLTGPAGKKPAYVAERVASTWALGPGWVDRVTAQLVLDTREGASLRGGQLATLDSPTTQAELDAVIDQAVQAAGQAVGVSISKPHAGGSTTGGVVDSAALDAYAEKLEGALETSARTLLAALGKTQTPAVFAEGEDDLHQLVTAELGSDWPKLVAPAFDAEKAVLLDDRWATAREDVVRVATGALKETDVTGAGEAVAAMARHFGLEDLANQALSDEGLDFAGQVAVVTGGSPNSIAAAVTGELLRGGATVIATTSRLDHERLEFYKGLYRNNARGRAALWVVPANLSSFADLDALIAWIGQEQTATVGASSKLVKPALVPDLIFPFAAPRVAGTLADAGPAAENQMRLLLWSVERIIGGLSALGTDTHVGHRLHVVLPGSPNRGRFGGDGAYGESKAALDALVNRWHAEQSAWGGRTSLVHAHIGWVRGTGLMGGNDPMVELVEARGVETFSTAQMARMLVGQGASAEAREKAAQSPVTLDFTGGLDTAELNLPELAREAAARATGAPAAPRTAQALPNPRTRIEWTTPEFSGVSAGLDDMVVIVGAGELGPLGSSRTRFEAEVDGGLSAAGVTELAWSMGLITFDGEWLDAQGQPVAEEDIYERFHDEVMANVGVRRYHDDFGPHMPMVDNLAPELTTIYLERELSFAVADEATAKSFVADVEGASAHFDGTEWQVTRPAGSPVRVPRRVAMSRFVGGQVPTGFDPSVYGIPADMIDNLDRVAVWNLVCTVDAFLSAGFSPAELLASVHPARVSSTQGTGMGGMASLRSLYVDKLLAQSRPNDILQEALPNVVAAHVMQSYVGGYGQMVHPVAACATAAVSVEEGVDKLRLRKADFVVAGGIDDLSIEGIEGFGDMAATADSAAMEAKGIEHKFFSRANDRRRGGFIESEGGGTLLLARGSLAAQLGLPVLGVVAFAESFADGAHTSIPAPGLGALSAARGGTDSRLAQSLAALGVSPDEVAVISKHDTSTNANDPNEADLHERVAAALGRSAGNPLYVISQKTLTGHAKGGAAAFQLVGLTQVLRAGIIPPNRALDCVDPAMAEHAHLTWLRLPLDLRHTPPKAGLVTSLGFGHVSALVAVVHPGAFLAALEAEEGQDAARTWQARAKAREQAGLDRLENAMRGGPALYQRPADRNLGGSGDAVKEREAAVLLDPDSRLAGGRLEPGVKSPGTNPSVPRL
ncbi:type I polyketide synthase [Corynebacterium phocae]|uniref:type I polyketide synthase n=1 Tax=Corynebacterium phocae TaxID=161895 RepID=UPI000A02B770